MRPRYAGCAALQDTTKTLTTDLKEYLRTRLGRHQSPSFAEPEPPASSALCTRGLAPFHLSPALLSYLHHPGSTRTRFQDHLQNQPKEESEGQFLIPETSKALFCWSVVLT